MAHQAGACRPRMLPAAVHDAALQDAQNDGDRIPERHVAVLPVRASCLPGGPAVCRRVSRHHPLDVHGVEVAGRAKMELGLARIARCAPFSLGNKGFLV